jgi:membrane protease subunit HflC
MERSRDQTTSVKPSGGSRLRVLLLVSTAALVALALVASLFTVDVKEYGLVTRFGKVVRVVSEPGLHIKAPFDRVARLDKRLTLSRPAPAEYLTVDKKNVVVESLATWHIADPERFLATLSVRSNADLPLADVIVGEIGAVLGKYPAASLIAPDGNGQRYRRVVSEIRDRVAGFARAAYGIEVADVELLHLSLPEQNREHVFERMKAERGKMAKEYRTYGEFSKNPAFYKFLRTLQAYEKFLDESTTLFLPADAEVLRMLRPQPRSSGALERGSTTVTSASNPARSVSIARPGRPGAGSAPADAFQQTSPPEQQ